MIDTFQIVGCELRGRGLALDATAVVGSEVPAERGTRLVEIAEVAYRQGTAAFQLDREDRFDLAVTVDALRALSTILGHTPAADRYRRSADVIAEILRRDQEVL